jgi:DNA mismatch repair protein MutS
MAPVQQLTPMLRHYLEVKERYPGAILLYRMGDFYEAFFEDAERAAPILEVALTARNKGRDNEAAMCGVPHHALEVYLAKLIRAGERVAICDQVEDPAEAKGLVKREVTRVVTPGTINEPELLEGKEENLLAGIVWEGEHGAAAFLDVSTGSFFVRRWERPEQGIEDLNLHRPREVLVLENGEGPSLPPEIEAWIERLGVCRTPAAETWFDSGRATDLLTRQFGVQTLRGFGVEEGEPAELSAALALAYARETQKSDLGHITGMSVRGEAEAMVLDPTTLTNLEVFRNQREGTSRTLLSTLDRTCSPAGGRRLREWLRRPLRRPAEIERRLEAVEELAGVASRRAHLREALGGLGDPERLLARAVVGRLTPREAASLRDGLGRVPEILAELASAGAGVLAEVAESDPVEDLRVELEGGLQESPATGAGEGAVIAEGIDVELDECRSLAHDSKRHILAIERRERERTGISSLKVRYNKVFGYYLEITKANQDRVPADYERKQTLVNAERYATPELKELEARILTAEERRVRIEERLFEKLVQRVAECGPRLLELSRRLAALDALAAFAEVAAAHDYRRPRIRAAGGGIEIKAGRHPVVERLSREPFVPNDVSLGGEAERIVVLTGPNMGGKSTYLRQVALIVLMAQAGSFVPAEEATISVVDRIFTRVGASDDLTRGESTFMVEMVETANILRQATSESLVILDEVGRGTATFDGLSLAWAIVEHLHGTACPPTLFATHYHELTELAAMLPGVVNRTMAVKEWKDRIVFLRRVVPGSADKSYGLQVARLAGIPHVVVERAAEILANLESQEYDLSGRPRLARGPGAPEGGPGQMNLFAPVEEVVASVLREVDVERLSPLAALNLLHSLKSRLSS